MSEQQSTSIQYGTIKNSLPILFFFAALATLLCSSKVDEGLISKNQHRTSIQDVGAVKEGILNLDKQQVLSGLAGLYHTNFKEIGNPLSPFYDLVTTNMSYGREDFLSLEIKHLLALVIRHMAQDIYQWDQTKNVGIADQTKQDLISGLDQLLKLLEPSKDPCVTSTMNLENTKVLVKQLSMSKNDASGKLSATIREIKQFVDDNITSDSIAASYKVLQRIHEIGSDVLEKDKEQALMLHLAVVASWRGIVLGPTRNAETTSLRKEEIEKMLGILRKYFGEKSLGEESSIQAVQNTVHSIIKKDRDSYRNLLATFVLEELETIKKKIEKAEKIQKQEIIPQLCNIAFYALVDLYATTRHTDVKCEILNVFGEMATFLDLSLLEDDNFLKSLIATRGSKSLETKSDKKLSNHIEGIALMSLIGIVLPPNLKNNNDPVTLSLTSGDTKDSSQEWKLRCTAVEALLRFDNFYREVQKQQQGNTPITDFLDLVGQEYLLISLFVDKLGLQEKQATELREFISHAKRAAEAKKLLTDKLKNGKYGLSVDAIKEILNFSSEKNEKISRAFKKLKNKTSRVDRVQRSDITLKHRNLTPEQVDLISAFQGEFSTEKLEAKRKPIKELLKDQLHLEDGECTIFLEFLQDDNKEEEGDKEEPQVKKDQEPYSGHSVRPVLDKLIHKFYLTSSERKLIDKAIFQFQGKHTDQASLIEKVAEALKNFFWQDGYAQIACTFKNLEKIRMMIEEEKKLVGGN